MALNIPSYLSIYSSVPFENAYGIISSLSINFQRKIGGFKINIHPTVDDYGKAPIGELNINLGDTGEAGQTIKTFDELMENPEFKESFDKLAYILYTESLKHPTLKDSNILEGETL